MSLPVPGLSSTVLFVEYELMVLVSLSSVKVLKKSIAAERISITLLFLSRRRLKKPRRPVDFFGMLKRSETIVGSSRSKCVYAVNRLILNAL